MRPAILLECGHAWQAADGSTRAEAAELLALCLATNDTVACPGCQTQRAVTGPVVGDALAALMDLYDQRHPRTPNYLRALAEFGYRSTVRDLHDARVAFVDLLPPASPHAAALAALDELEAALAAMSWPDMARGSTTVLAMYQRLIGSCRQDVGHHRLASERGMA